MLTKVQKWGNSYALRIPKALAEELQFTLESAVELHIENGKLIIEPVGKTEYTLDQLLAGITPENMHAEVDWGEPVGLEV